MIDISVSNFYTGDCRKLLRQLPPGSIQTCISSPPYWGLRDYDADGQIGLEPTPKAYVAELVKVFELVRRALRDDGTLWLNLGDSYSHGGCGARDGQRWPKQQRNKGSLSEKTKHAKNNTGLKPKDLIGIPWEVAFALRKAGWYLRADIIWHKPNPMPESVTDRPTKAHEYLFLFAKSEDYYYDASAISEPTSGNAHPRGNGVNPKAAANAAGSRQNASWSAAVSDLVETRNKRSVWTVDDDVRANRKRSGNKERTYRADRGGNPAMPSGQAMGVPWEDETGLRNKRSVWTVAPIPYSGAHFAVYPPALIEPCILASSRPGDVVLDPFFGSGTTGEVAEKHERRWIGFDVNPAYQKLQAERTAQRSLPLSSRPEVPHG